MKDLNITIDLETCGLCPTAAVMSVGAVAWKGLPYLFDAMASKQKPVSPFFDEDCLSCPEFSAHVDLRSQFVDEFTFDTQTARWWKNADHEAKKALLSTGEFPPEPIELVLRRLFVWIEDFCDDKQTERVYLWAQGTDFDLAVLRNICHVYNLKLPVSFQYFRDHRSVYMEIARVYCQLTKQTFDTKNAYNLVDNYRGDGVPHSPIFDCKRSIYSTCQIYQLLFDGIRQQCYPEDLKISDL